MASLKTHISWTDSTWNPTTGCTKVSAGCDHCYAEALTNRLLGGGFDIVREHPDRLRQVHGFKPLKDEAGTLRPRQVFVNSMSDVFHIDITPGFRDQIFDAIDAKADAVFQVLTKRPAQLRSYIKARYRKGVPPQLWLGVTSEDNRVSQRLTLLRRLKDDVGDFTAFVSVEPLIGPCSEHDYSGLDWILIGGESGPGARPMNLEWARCARDRARADGCATWFKQFGTWPNNPLYLKAKGPLHIDRVRQAILGGEKQADVIHDNGRLKIVGEKGGATLDGEVLHEHPRAYHRHIARLNTPTSGQLAL